MPYRRKFSDTGKEAPGVRSCTQGDPMHRIVSVSALVLIALVAFVAPSFAGDPTQPTSWSLLKQIYR